MTLIVVTSIIAAETGRVRRRQNGDLRRVIGFSNAVIDDKGDRGAGLDIDLGPSQAARVARLIGERFEGLSGDVRSLDD